MIPLCRLNFKLSSPQGDNQLLRLGHAAHPALLMAMGENGRRHPAEDLLQALALAVLHAMNLVPHDREQGFDQVGGTQTLAQFTCDAQGMKGEQLLTDFVY